MNVGSLAASVGLRPLIFAAIVGSKVPLFASPRFTVCEPLHLIAHLLGLGRLVL
jgi:hypothetical protein